MTDEPIEPDEVTPAGSGASLDWTGRAPDADAADTSWIENAGFEVTRQAPPVGSVTIGVPGVGFDLYVPGEHGKVLAEAYGPDGKQRDRSTLSGAKVPEKALQADESQRKGTDDTSLSEATPTEDPGIEPFFPDLGIVHDRTLD
jgi:hypothetical protein